MIAPVCVAPAAEARSVLLAWRPGPCRAVCATPDSWEMNIFC
ncbi:Mycobacterium numidiamassiliense ORFan [Mycobacterium numidiamassiliense]|uniref:Mycobacterium numidiamassiliense ORFan n=1 Tax=Mycobacterium numidiamassiliense TaxID=1841861 RepID=A0A2U3P5N4_9MYCO|nr:Mycobacterium numidiamassiliense ORFan [Mycobacterium numidiamassiliense]